MIVRAIRSFIIGTIVILGLTACPGKPTSSDIQRDRQERQIQEGIAQVGVAAIKNFRMLKLLKDIQEMQDQEGLVTYTYVENLVSTVVRGHTVRGGKFTFFCDSFGYPIPYATQFSAPESMQRFILPAKKKSGSCGRSCATTTSRAEWALYACFCRWDVGDL